MTPNVVPQPSFQDQRSLDHRSPARSGATRPKAILSPIRQRDVNGTPQVWLKNISLRFRVDNSTRLLALDNFNLKVKPDECLCIVCPSGCDKSTLLQLIAGLHQT